MKVCIVTVYDNINSGSFWQSYTLGKTYEKNGCEVFYLKRKFSERLKIKFNHLKKIIYKYLFKGINAGRGQLEIYKQFNNSIKEFNIINWSDIDDMDRIIIGSDTLWNIDSKYFKRNYKVFFGGEFTKKIQATYAISSANVDLNKILQLKNIKEYVDNFKYLSVRDNNTLEIAKKIYNKDIQFVCDPTMLFESSEYAKLINNDRPKYKYIFLYLFQDLNEEQLEQLKQFSKYNNLKIVSGIKKNKYCDYYINNSPMNFLTYMYYADYIITDTFHGTVFSINFNKNFICMNRKKKKVLNLLEYFKLNNRLAQDTIDNYFEQEIDYKTTNEIIGNLRNNSINYIENTLNDL